MAQQGSDFFGDMLVLVLGVFVGVTAVVWFSQLPTETKAAVIGGGSSLLTILLGQPALFLTLAILRQSQWTKVSRGFYAVAVIGVFGIALPLYLGSLFEANAMAAAVS